jgi:hypothetical protein
MFVDWWNYTSLLGPNSLDLHICKQDNPGMSVFVEDVNSYVRGTHEFHENWATTNSNDFTVSYLEMGVLSEGSWLVGERSLECNHNLKGNN